MRSPQRKGMKSNIEGEIKELKVEFRTFKEEIGRLKKEVQE